MIFMFCLCIIQLPESTSRALCGSLILSVAIGSNSPSKGVYLTRDDNLIKHLLMSDYSFIRIWMIL